MTDSTELKEKSETPWSADDAAFSARYTQFIAPFWRDKVVNGYFSGKGNIQIAYAFVINPHGIGSIAISSGRIETLLKYQELVFNLYHAGFSVFIHDHRGQGLSGRMTDNPQQGYVDSFSDYVEDFKTFFDTIISENSSHQPVVIGHSMGGAIATQYILTYPNDFQKCVLSAPMFGIKPALPAWFANILLNTHLIFNQWFSPTPWYFIGQSDYQNLPFEQNVLTSSRARYKVFRDQYEQQSQCKLGGVTAKWLLEAYRCMAYIYQHAADIKIPILVLQAGNDKVVDNNQQNKFLLRMRSAKVQIIENGKHELFMEQELIRDKCLRETLNFLAPIKKP
ncbi:alpha/beta fold hydrolase [Aliiglaciecola sp. LCG003]|uniref:alpha/beta fold hydrolase n=1 Tax=Aliiglaciecola sp. LCG003 TaxID=3053655 RepID=UPI00257257DB|nr:alpha/beta fold hydrolase [Aliiglaciecola sp. LCG003]WJG10029.1 alpha/beta fold hydrolase [Aliiglaciecola sp. LCG003]